MDFDKVLQSMLNESNKEKEDKLIKEIGELWKKSTSMEYIRKNYPKNVVSKFLVAKGKPKDYND
jgi:predicted adenine nucleotide alpha hydrolase (AANH) superfamily ATPase